MADKKNKEETISELDELRYARQVYQNQYMLINNSAQAVLQEMRELGASQRTLENIELFNGKESLISTGAGVYIRAVANNDSKVLVEVGGNYVAEKSADEGQGFLEQADRKQDSGIEQDPKEQERSGVCTDRHRVQIG